jgi:hypothetical protein
MRELDLEESRLEISAAPRPNQEEPPESVLTS